MGQTNSYSKLKMSISHKIHNKSHNTQKQDTENNNISSFTAEGEANKAEIVILYEPGMEVFLSCLHPKGSLYEKTTTRKKVKESYNNYVSLLKKKNIRVCNVRDILKKNDSKLLDLAARSLKYKCIDNNDNNDITDDIKKEEEEKEEETEMKYNNNIDSYINDKYKMDVLNELDNDDLIDIILCQPIIEVSSCGINTGINIEYIKSKPVGNLVFCRDQQITTNKGVVIGHLNSSQRQFETEIMKLVFSNLNIEPIGYIPNKYHLEGGDFIPINGDLCLLGIGLRTDFGAAQYLMDNDLLGTKQFAVIIDENDQNQNRMHLDTVFNVINHDSVIVLNFDTVPHQSAKGISRKVNIYEKNNSDKYELISSDIDFYKFLEMKFKNIIKVNHKQQLKYIINFLNIGNNTIISVNDHLKGLIEENNIKVNVEYVEFDGIKSMYGAAHCATQVSRKRKPSTQRVRRR